MNINDNGTQPIYIQIADWLENEILYERILPEGKIYSQYQLAELFNINPATAAKGITILAEQNIVYKKRGLGMFVSEGAKDIIREKRRSTTFQALLGQLVDEACRLQIGIDEVITTLTMLWEGKDDERQHD